MDLYLGLAFSRNLQYVGERTLRDRTFKPKPGRREKFSHRMRFQADASAGADVL